MKKSNVTHKPYDKVAWTQPWWWTSEPTDGTSTTTLYLPFIPFRYYRLRSVIVHASAHTASGTDDTWDLQGYDIDGGSGNADMFTFTPEDLAALKTYVMHVDASKCGYYTFGSSLFTADTGLQIVPKVINLFSTVDDSDIPAENRGMVPAIVIAGSPTALTYQVSFGIDPVDDW